MDFFNGVGAELMFRNAVALYPLATLLHILEEWPRFPRWARRFASPQYSDREYQLTHVAAVAIAAVVFLLLSNFTRSWLVFLFFAFVFGPGVFWNAFFHMAATIRTRAYCAGVVTGLLIYLPLSLLLGRLALREGLISAPLLSIALAVALAAHIVEVGHNVFKRW